MKISRILLSALLLTPTVVLADGGEAAIPILLNFGALLLAMPIVLIFAAGLKRKLWGIVGCILGTILFWIVGNIASATLYFSWMFLVLALASPALGAGIVLKLVKRAPQS